jgi:MerR family transcriptional regulator, light-induced transcriptional regulator
MASDAPISERSPAGLLGLQEAADRLGVHYMTAYRYVRTGRLPATRIGAQWWVDPRDLHQAGQEATVAGRPRAATRKASGASAVRRLEDRLVAGDEPGAWTIVESRLGSGSDPDDVLLDGLGQAMRSVGEGWEAGAYTVDDEHRASGVALRVVARLGARFTTRGPKRGSVILGTPPHELHGLPTAMAANVLRGHGFEVVDLGADVPEGAFGHAVSKTPRAVAVAVGVTAGNHDRAVRGIVRAVQAVKPALPVLVGGAGIDGEEHAARLGARWSGRDARSLGDAIDAVERAAP